jgi:hypothetical protein
MVEIARTHLDAIGGKHVPVAAVSTAFPSGRASMEVKIQDTQDAINAGAAEIDMVIDRGAFLAGKYGLVFDEIVKITGKDARFIGKTCTYSNLYGEGMTLFEKGDLTDPRVIKARDCGALKVYEDWIYHGYTVAFSGVNMADRLFNHASLENRSKVNDIVENNIMKIYPIREWQRSVLKEAESNLIKSPTGRFLRLYDSAKDKAKVALAFKGQGLGADHVQTVILRFYQKYGKLGVPLIQVHDELVFEKPRSWSKEECIDFMSVAEEEDYRIKGFICPVKMYWGENWAQMERIK